MTMGVPHESAAAANFSFTPLWEEDAFRGIPTEDVNKLYVKILKRITASSSLDQQTKKQVPDPAQRVLSAITVVISDLGASNTVLERIRKTAVTHTGGDPVLLIRAAVGLWYLETLQILGNNEANRTQEQRRDESGELIMPWAQGYHADFPISNLGHMAILYTQKNRPSPPDDKHEPSILIANAAVSLLYAAYAISPHLKDDTMFEITTFCHDERSLRLFLDVTWKIGFRKGARKVPTGLGHEYGIAPGDTRMSKGGRRLLIRTGPKGTVWAPAPYWHPYLQLPGSPWNHFIKNLKQPIFPCDKPHEEKPVQYLLPTGALKLVEPYEAYYSQLRARAQEAKPEEERFEPSEQQRLAQFSRVARFAGRPYARQEPTREVAEYIHDANPEELYWTPAVQKPRDNENGFLTLHFLNTTADAFRFGQDPVGDGNDFFILSFEL